MTDLLNSYGNETTIRRTLNYQDHAIDVADLRHRIFASQLILANQEMNTRGQFTAR
jgi:hypothetical protein